MSAELVALLREAADRIQLSRLVVTEQERQIIERLRLVADSMEREL